jgi:peptidyl-prolyl cis-trans isomerase SurA
MSKTTKFLNQPWLARMACAWTVCASAVCLAQGIRLGGPSLGPTLNPPTANTTSGARSSDFIVAVVDAEPITNQELQQQVEQTVLQMQQQQGGFVPRREVLVRQVLERLIDERAQLRLAQELGIRIEDSVLEQSEQGMATQNGVSLEAFRERLAQQGMSQVQFRADLRQQLTLQRLREREVNARIRITEPEIDKLLAERIKTSQEADPVLSLGHILLAVPDDASEAQRQETRLRAQALVEKLKGGADFAALARDNSDASDKASGGMMGLRPAQRYPSLFVDAVKTLAVGQLAGPVPSGAGFHILKLIERRQPQATTLTVPQTLARHILLRPGEQLSPNAARARMLEIKSQIDSGRAEFATMARLHSQDGSAAKGGDLGWAGPGMFVPEFEEAMNKLAPGQTSPPVVTRFGVHLIQVMERRQAELSVKEQRELARNILREQKLEDSYRAWAQETRGRSYVEYRDDPL